MSFAQNLKRYRIANYESTAKSAREPRVSEVPLIAKALGVSLLPVPAGREGE